MLLVVFNGAIDGEGAGVIGVFFVFIVVASSIREFVVSNVDDSIAGAVGCGCEGGGVDGAGNSFPVGEGSTCDGDVGLNEVRGGF